MSTAPSARELAHDQPSGDPSGEYVRLRELLVGPEQARLEELQRRLDDRQLRTEDISQVVAEAIALRIRRDRTLQHTLNPLVEEAVRISVARDPRILSDTLFPIIGAAVRKAVAHALRGLVASINQTLERSLSLESLKWRLEAVRTGKPFGQVVLTHSLRYRVEQVFLIHRETGLLLQHVARADQVVQDSELVSGMLTAIQDFVRDSFTGTGGQEVETIELGEFNLWVQHGPAAILAAVVSGTPPPELRNVLERALEQVHSRFAEAFSTFKGDSAGFAEARPLLMECLLGRQPKAAKAGSGFFLTAALAVIALIATGVFFLARRETRWDKLVERLRAEPGIVLTSAEESWGGYRLIGLRDPLSADPEKLIRASGLDPAKVVMRWEPYVSLDPRFKVSRQFLAERDALQAEVLRFPLSSAQLSPEHLVKLDDVEAHLVNLQQDAASIGQRFVVEVRGHTDPTGNEDKNASLSQARADAVVKALVERGVSVEMLKSVAMGSSEPVRRATSAYLTELNRRVDFHVALASEAPR
jgi:OOP family OmpA-OmpF porin